MTTPEARARTEIDALLLAAGWQVQDRAQLNLAAGRGVAVREFVLKTDYAGYLLFVGRKAIGAIETKAVGIPLSGVESQSEKYSVGLPDLPPAWRKPLPFLYESTGVETFFTNGLDPAPRSRRMFAFHRPETLAEWVKAPTTLRARLRDLPPLITTGLWDAQIEAITSLEQSLAADKPRAALGAARRGSELQRQAILKRAFEGKLVPHDPNDEPASVLLERIRKERESQNGIKKLKQTRMEL